MLFPSEKIELLFTFDEDTQNNISSWLRSPSRNSTDDFFISADQEKDGNHPEVQLSHETGSPFGIDPHLPNSLCSTSCISSTDVTSHSSQINDSDSREYSEKFGENLEKNAQEEFSLKNHWDRNNNSYLFDSVLKYRNNWKRISKALKEQKMINIDPINLRKIYEDLMLQKKRERKKFTHADDLAIVRQIQNYGFDWIRIAQHFSGRSPSNIKNRYYSHIKKNRLMEKFIEELDYFEKCKVQMNFNL